MLKLKKEKEDLELRNKQLEEEVRALREENKQIRDEYKEQQPNLEKEIGNFLSNYTVYFNYKIKNYNTKQLYVYKRAY